MEKEMSLMKILRSLMKTFKGRFYRKAGKDEEFRCTETSCQSIKKIKRSIDQSNPAREHCFNISNCSL